MSPRRRSKRRRAAASAQGAADLISGLGDDVLVRILELLPDAVDAVRTGALSRRWRGLWTRAASLTFDSSIRRLKSRRASIDQQFLDFVHDVLAQRAKADAALDLEHLAISFSIGDDQPTKPLVLRSTDAAAEWIRYAVQERVRSFVLELQFPRRIWECRETCNFWKERPMIDLSELASSSKLEAMHWKLKDVRLGLPATAVFTSLVDLSLEDIELVAGSGHLLARLLSSPCCPSLQKLRLRNLRLLELDELLIEASALLELSMSSIPTVGPTTLKLKTPSLQILHIEDYDEYLRTLGIFAPRLEEVTFWPHQAHHIDIEGELPCVKSLEVRLDSHGDEDDDINNGAICLLQCCTSLTCLEVVLDIPLDISVEDEHLVADIISGRIPHFPHLISLTIHVDSLDLHSFGVGVSEILKQCSYLKYLSVHYSIDTPELDDDDFLCDHPDHNKSHRVCFANIEEVRFMGLAGTECESYFIQGVLAYATRLQKVALSFDPKLRQYNNMLDYSNFITCNGGTWVRDDWSLSYEWNSD